MDGYFEIGRGYDAEATVIAIQAITPQEREDLEREGWRIRRVTFARSIPGWMRGRDEP